MLNIIKKRKNEAGNAFERIEVLLTGIMDVLEKEEPTIYDFLEKMNEIGRYPISNKELYGDIIKLRLNQKNRERKKFINQFFLLGAKRDNELAKQNPNERLIESFTERIVFLYNQLGNTNMTSKIIDTVKQIKSEFNLIHNCYKFSDEDSEFKTRLLERDCVEVDGQKRFKCMVSGAEIDSMYLDAVQIIPASKFAKIYSRIKQYLYSIEHGCMDVRNGLIMCRKSRELYEKGLFKIVFEEETQRYKCIASNVVEQNDIDKVGELGFQKADDGQYVKWITFREDKRDEWPSPDLLKMSPQ